MLSALDDYPQLETSRLLLRGFRDDDLAYLQAFALRPILWRYLPGPEPTAELVAAYHEARLLAQAEAALSGRDDSGDWHFAVESRDFGFIIGTGRLNIQSREHGNGAVAVSLDSEHWGQGLGREVLGALCDFGFEAIGLHRLSALIDAENLPSQHIAAACGFVREGLLRQNFRLRGVWRDSYLYARLNPGEV